MTGTERGAYVTLGRAVEERGLGCHWDTFDRDGMFWAECECGFESVTYRNVVSAMRDAEMHLPYPCASCGAWRRRHEMQAAADRMWRTIPNSYVCRDQKLCFEEVVKAAHASGDARRAASPKTETGASDV